MIRIELGEEVERHGRWRWTCAQFALEGVSRQPLLDACRAIERMGAATGSSLAGLYRPGRDCADLICSVAHGAGLTVDENGPRFKKWIARDPSTIPSG
jgi:hypothetical protein